MIAGANQGIGLQAFATDEVPVDKLDVAIVELDQLPFEDKAAMLDAMPATVVPAPTPAPTAPPSESA